jgi:hypothetical protein
MRLSGGKGRRVAAAPAPAMVGAEMDRVISPTDWPKYPSPLEIASMAH